MMHHLILLAVLLAGDVSCGSDFECDEDTVQPVCLPEDYDSFLPPKEGRVNISVSADYIQVVEVNEEELSITFDVFLNLEWVEPRLQLQPGHKGLSKFYVSSASGESIIHCSLFQLLLMRR